MAEAAVAFAAFEAVETTAQVAVVGGYAVAQATLPLKTTLACFATATAGADSSSSLSRSGHTISVIDHVAYIFGGITDDAGTLAGNDMHQVKLPSRKTTEDVVAGESWEYKAVPAIASGTDDVPASRTEHTTCVIDRKIHLFGGQDGTGNALEERGRVWVFDPSSSTWSHLDPPSGLGGVYPTLYLHAADAFITDSTSSIVVLGGKLPDGSVSTGVWIFDLLTTTWKALQVAMMPRQIDESSMPLPPNMVVVHDKLYTITGSSQLSSSLHILDLSRALNDLSWETKSFPSNGLSPGPRPRRGGSLIHISIGQGREYLIYFFGLKTQTLETSTEDKTAMDRGQERPSQWSDMWAYQLPSDASTSAKLKDRIREALPGGITSREGEWAEVEVDINQAAMTTVEGSSPVGAMAKAHPGPRAFFAASSVSSDTGGFGVRLGEKANKIVLWGGLDPSGRRHGDGWEVEFHL